MKKYSFVVWTLLLSVSILPAGCSMSGGGGGPIIYTYTSADVPLVVPDLDQTVSALIVNGAPPYISGMTVTLVLHHTSVSDLDIILESPEGYSIYLTYGSSSGEDFWYTTFDDYSPFDIEDTDIGDDPRTGSYRPYNPLAFFDGEDPNGIWYLIIDDLVSEDFGYLVDWSIDIW